MDAQKKVFIIGAGASGVGMAIQLQRLLGHQNFTIFEKSDNLGGTWWHNRYPACACDIPSHLYSYSFAMKADWTTTYPERDELHGYFMSVAERYDVPHRCEFNTMCLKMVWDAVRSKWTCTFKSELTGEIFTREADIVVSAVGTLDRPSIPEIAGMENFKGDAFHSARWDAGVDVKDKDIVVLGNGASATQFVPRLAKQVGARGTVTQIVRSAHWWTKRGNPKCSKAFMALLEYVPIAARIYRGLLAYDLEKTFYSFYMNSAGAALRNEIKRNTYKYIEKEAPAEYREILKPNYEPGCKRRVNTLDYLKTLHAPNMHLAKERVTQIGERSVTTAEGHIYPADVLIYATGFLTQRWLFPMEVRGRGGCNLQDVWEQAGGAEAYKGTVVTDFPNFFILYGPNAATGQHSVIFHSECQINYSCRLLKPVLKGNADSLMVKPQAQKRELAWVHENLHNLVFNSGCASWWMDPETGKNTFIYPDPMFKYWMRTLFPTWSDFDVIKNGSHVQQRGFFSKVGLFLTFGSAIGVGLLSYQQEKPMTSLASEALSYARGMVSSISG